MTKKNISFSKNNKVILVSLVLCAVLFFTAILASYIRQQLGLTATEPLLSSNLIVIMPLFLGGVVAFITILNNDKNDIEIVNEPSKNENVSFKESSFAIPADERELLVKKLYKLVQEEATEQFIDYIKSVLANNDNRKQVIGFFNESTIRMNNHIKKLSNLSMINLTIGVIISGFSISILYLSIVDFSSGENMANTMNASFYLFSRMGVGVAIQLLALFFLNLYKKNIHEMKYTQNEITNIESKKAAILYSYDFSEGNKFLIADELLKTERNFVLDKSQTTMHLEQSKIDSRESKDLFNVIELLLKKDKH